MSFAALVKGWIAVMMLVKLPWNQRCWARPFLTVLAPSEAANLEAKGRHKTTVDWTMQMVKQVSRWLGRQWVLIGAFKCMFFIFIQGQKKNRE